MICIEKNGKAYVVTECKDKWTVKSDCGTVSVSVNVPKNICGTENEIREYVLTEDLF